MKNKKIKEMYEPISSFKSFKFIDKTNQGLEIVKLFKDLSDDRLHVVAKKDTDAPFGAYIVGLGYTPDKGYWNQGRYNFETEEDAIKSLKKDYRVLKINKDELKSNSIKEKLNMDKEKNIKAVKKQRPNIIKESVDTNDLAKWFKESVQDSIDTDDAWVYSYNLDENYAVVIKWEPGFGEETRDDVIQSKEEPDYGLCRAIVVRDSSYFMDDWNMPYEENGDVIDTDHGISPKFDNIEEAKDIIFDYNDIITHYELIDDDGKVKEITKSEGLHKNSNKNLKENDSTESEFEPPFEIEYWANEEAREYGLGDIYIDEFDSLEEAKKTADKLFEENAAVEVLDSNGEVAYGLYDDEDDYDESDEDDYDEDELDETKEIKKSKIKSNNLKETFSSKDKELEKGLKNGTIRINDELIAKKNKELDIHKKIDLMNATSDLLDMGLEYRYYNNTYFDFSPSGYHNTAGNNKPWRLFFVNELDDWFGIMNDLESNGFDLYDYDNFYENLIKIASIINVSVNDLILKDTTKKTLGERGDLTISAYTESGTPQSISNLGKYRVIMDIIEDCFTFEEISDELSESDSVHGKWELHKILNNGKKAIFLSTDKLGNTDILEVRLNLNEDANNTIKKFKEDNNREQNIRIKENKTLKEEPMYDLNTRFDSRKSFYGKAKVEERNDGSIVLYSYGTAVVGIRDGKATLLHEGYRGWNSSQTTLRHVKDFLQQNGFKVGTSKELEKMYPDMQFVDWINAKTESCNESKKSIKEAKSYRDYDEVAIEKTKDGKEIYASGSTDQTRTYWREFVKLEIEDLGIGHGVYKWMNRPWQRWDYSSALEDAMEELGISEDIRKKCIEESHDLKSAVTWLAQNLPLTKDTIKESTEKDSDYKKQLKELEKIVSSFKGSFKELYHKLQGRNLEDNLFDVYYKGIGTTIYNDNGKFTVDHNVDLYTPDEGHVDTVKLKENKEEISDKEIIDILGIEQEKDNPSMKDFKSISKQFRDLAKKHDKNKIWLIADHPNYTKGNKVVEKTKDLVVVEACQLKENKLKDEKVVKGKSLSDYKKQFGDKYDNGELWDFSKKDLEDGAVEINPDMTYWEIDDRYYETEECSKSKNKKQSKLDESVKIISDLDDYEPWSGAVDLWNEIVDNDLVDSLDFMLEDIYPDGLTMTELNDLLWFEEDFVREQLGLSSGSNDEDDFDEIEDDE